MTLAPLWDHVAELRRTILYSLAVILLCTCVALYFYEDVFQALTWPLHANPLQRQEMRRERVVNTGRDTVFYTLPGQAEFLSAGVKSLGHGRYAIPSGESIEWTRAVKADTLAVLGPVEGMLITFKVCFWLGVVISAPLWVFFVLRFVTPALRPAEKRLILPFLLLSSLFMGMGACLAYSITIPLANQYLQAFNASIGTNFWSLTQYLDYTLFLILANALAFEIGVILLFLVHYGVLTAETMAAKRRHMIVIAFILGALLTPPDVLTQCMLAIPLIGLYEVILLYAKILHKKHLHLSLKKLN